MIDFPIIDSHIHLLDRQRFSYAWSVDKSWTKSLAKLERNWNADDFAERAKPYQIEGFVFVEGDAELAHYRAEARWAEQLASTDDRIKGCVVSLPLERGPSIENELAEIASLPHVRGVRRLIQNMPDLAVILENPFLDALRLLPKYNLLFDICIFHHQFSRTIEMVRRCPQVVFVLDHIGRPNIKAGLMDPWRRHITEIAALPNVYCKLSGALTEADHAAWTRDQILPFLSHVIQEFGVDRVMFGGDWPVFELAGRYGDWVEVVDYATSGMGVTEKRKIFRDNALKIYRLLEQRHPGTTLPI
ncbi:amidohydrolase family protein [Paraburkholderia sp. SIMBA_049]